MRTSYKTLTDEEYNVLNLISRRNKNDFGVGSTIFQFDQDGKCFSLVWLNAPSPETGAADKAIPNGNLDNRINLAKNICEQQLKSFASVPKKEMILYDDFSSL